MRLIRPEEVPDFNDLVDFTDWYLRSGAPLLIPLSAETFLSDDATATCLFRKGRFQFELYLIHSNPLIPEHEHPGVANIEIPQSEFSMMAKESLAARVQTAGQEHGLGIKRRAGGAGFALFSAQQWDTGITMSTIGARWKGHTAGPKHEALIRRFTPDCYIQNGYADVTRKAL